MVEYEDEQLVAETTTRILGDVVEHIDLQQNNLVAENAGLAELVRERYPAVPDTTADIVAKLREPGVLQEMMAAPLTGDGNLGERRLLQVFSDMESERLPAVRVEAVMGAELARLNTPAPVVVPEAAPESAPESAPEVAPEAVAVVARPLLYGENMNDDVIRGDIGHLTMIGLASLPMGFTSTDLERAVYQRLDPALQTGDRQQIATISTEILGQLDTHLEGHQRQIIEANPALATYVREQFPGTGDTTDDVLARLREPGVIDDILTNRMTGLGSFFSTGPLLLNTIQTLEDHRASAGNIAGAMNRELQSLRNPAPENGTDAFTAAADPAAIQERIDSAFEADQPPVDPALQDDLQNYVARQNVPGTGL
jgi:hypothetical protein